MNMNCTHKSKFSTFDVENEKRTKFVLGLTVVMIVIEIASGYVFGSMALLADGWHMGTHAAAFGITLYAYQFAKKNRVSREFSYGTGKVSVLGGYTSAVALGIVALMMCIESLERFINPQSIEFSEAIFVAVVGLVVNVVSMFILHEHHDHNIRAAYMHVLADAITSLLAIVALVVGKYVGWYWLDSMMGVVGAVVITKWAFGLAKQTAPILLDKQIDQAFEQSVIAVIEQEGGKVTDIHIWQISAKHYAASICIETEIVSEPKYFRNALAHFDTLSHLTLEVNSRG